MNEFCEGLALPQTRLNWGTKASSWTPLFFSLATKMAAGKLNRQLIAFH
jgi:hypothetical protein